MKTKDMTILNLQESIAYSPLRRGFLLITLTLVCFALPPKARALLPAPTPDGAYPGWNTAEGSGALFNVTTGNFNTAIGGHALYGETYGSANTAIGAFSLSSNNAGFWNVAVGQGALHDNTDGFGNTAVGYQALYRNPGRGKLNSGNDNTATGYQALYNNNGAGNNTATGSGALYQTTTGNFNTADGFRALYSNTTGGGSPPFDPYGGNTAIGYFALYNNTTGSGNTALGNQAGSSVTTANGVICIGALGANVDNSCYIGHISGADATGGDPVFITSAGKLGTVNPPSAARFKEEIKPMNEASQAILALKPVTFRYKKEFDPKGVPQFGLVAEDVEKVNPDLVKRDRDGNLQTVRYDAVNAMLLNEFLKEHREVAELKSIVAEQRKSMEQMATQLKGQAAQIQKVSAQVEVNRSVRQIVVNE
jgi:hypothetical protein